MPQINVQVGSRNLVINYEEGADGFVEIQDAGSDTSLHIRDEDGTLLALHFVEGQEDPASQIDFVTGDVYLD